jgi:hypothetical protein
MGKQDPQLKTGLIMNKATREARIKSKRRVPALIVSPVSAGIRRFFPQVEEDAGYEWHKAKAAEWAKSFYGCLTPFLIR